MRVRYMFLSFSVFTAFTAFMPGGPPTAVRGSSPTQSSIAQRATTLSGEIADRSLAFGATKLRSGEFADRRLALGATTTSVNQTTTSPYQRISKKFPKRLSPSPVPTTTGLPVPSPTGTPSSFPSVSADCSGITIPAGANIQSVIDDNPSGTTFCLSGTYSASSLAPKANDVFMGGKLVGNGAGHAFSSSVTGVTLDGVEVTGYAPTHYQAAVQISGSGWTVRKSIGSAVAHGF
jgi:hypothetical protein